MEKKTADLIWKNCLEVIKDNVNTQNFKTWFEPIKPLKLAQNILTIQVPSQFFYEWLEEHYITLLKKTIRKELGTEGKLEYSIIMENAYGRTEKPITMKVPTMNAKELKNPSVNMPIDISSNPIKNTFIIP